MTNVSKEELRLALQGDHRSPSVQLLRSLAGGDYDIRTRVIATNELLRTYVDRAEGPAGPPRDEAAHIAAMLADLREDHVTMCVLSRRQAYAAVFLAGTPLKVLGVVPAENALTEGAQRP